MPKEIASVDPPNRNDLVKLIENEFRIERISSENNFIDIKFQGKTFKQSYFNLLSKVGENIKRLDLSFVDLSSVNLSKLDDLNKMFEELIAEGNSVGAKLGVCVENCPVGLGEPVFDKLNADLAKAIMSINAVKSVSIGNAENILNLKGSEIRDEIRSDGFASNNAGGILGGISNGDNIDLDFLIKPTSSIKKKGKTVDKDGNEVDIEVTGRHDPCVGIRAVPIAEAMVNLVIMDHVLRNRAQCGEVNQQLPFTK